jgi:3-deoxy-D-manno-octulosonic-acid transferase
VIYLYSFLIYCALPFIFLRVLWRSRRLPAYRKRLLERLGYYPLHLDKCLWVHAVSVGETIAALPMIKSLQARYPHLPMLVTTMTPTGAARVALALGDTATHAYLPYDFPGAVQRFLNAFHPVACIIMETELWPNMVAACERRHIPVALVNARLSEKSAKGYQRVAWLTREMLGHIDLIAANGQVDADRFLALGAKPDSVKVTGNIKFDLSLPTHLASDSEALRMLLGKDRFIWIAASTHDGEEEIVLAAHKKLLEKHPQALLILVPRHPDRFNLVAKQCEQAFQTERRSKSITMAGAATMQVYLGDTMGELLLMYSVADVALVAGSLVPRGGHNMLEPAVLQKAMLTGPHIFNFKEISDLFFAKQALRIVADSDELFSQLSALMSDAAEREQMGQRASQVVQDNRGALDKQLALIDKLLGKL